MIIGVNLEIRVRLKCDWEKILYENLGSVVTPTDNFWGT